MTPGHEEELRQIMAASSDDVGSSAVTGGETKVNESGNQEQAAQERHLQVAMAARLRIDEHARAIAQLNDIAPNDSGAELCASIEYLREFGSDDGEQDSALYRFRRLCQDAVHSYGSVTPTDEEVLKNCATPALVRYVLRAMQEIQDTGALDAPLDLKGRSIATAQRAAGTALGLAKRSPGALGSWRKMTPELRDIARQAMVDASLQMGSETAMEAAALGQR